jgi:3-deoxy-D-manno-octulosonate 8-phosphate phosphatase (KDO 8-P phosphatase)
MAIKLFLSDVDGVMTDAGMYYSEQGDELKRFNTLDGMGFKLLQAAGIQTGIITSERVELNRRRAQKLALEHICTGVALKVVEAERIWAETGITPAETAYIGDDINCIGLLRIVGLAACPPNAVPRVKAIPNIHHLKIPGGQGCVRELADHILDTEHPELDPYTIWIEAATKRAR